MPTSFEFIVANVIIYGDKPLCSILKRKRYFRLVKPSLLLSFTPCGGSPDTVAVGGKKCIKTLVYQYLPSEEMRRGQLNFFTNKPTRKYTDMHERAHHVHNHLPAANQPDARTHHSDSCCTWSSRIAGAYLYKTPQPPQIVLKSVHSTGFKANLISALSALEIAT